jgi:exonuclease SbcC
MRPLRLEVEGFTAFRQPVVVDFDGADLFALVGPTGAGKTSVLDAITFALYGTVPRLDDRRAVAPIVSQNLTEARVRLDFAVGAAHYTAVRVVRAFKTGASTKEARLERDGEVLAGTADEVSAAVTELLGLSYEHFTTCVSLPQGQFARFLHDKPRDRQDLLVRLLELGLYDRVASAARQLGALASGRADIMTGQLDRLAGATPEAHAEAVAQRESLAELISRLAAARPEIEALTQAAAAARDQADGCAQRLAVLKDLQAPDGVAELSETLNATTTARAESIALEEARANELAEVESQLSQLPARSQVEAQCAALRRRDELVLSVSKGRDAATTAATRVAEGAAAEAEAEAERERCADEVERVRVEQRAHALVPELQVGEPCPVCQQPVATLPEVHLPDLKAAEAALAASEKRLKQASRTLTDARTDQARVDEKLQQIDMELAEVTARLDGVASPESLDAVLAEINAAEVAVGQAREADRSARNARRAIEQRHDEALAREAQARKAFDAARDAVAALEPPPTERRDLAADWQALIDWVEQRRPALLEETETHRRRAGELAGQAQAKLDELIGVCCDAGVLDAPSNEWPGEAVAAAHARAQELVQRLDDDRAEAARLEDQVRAATEDRQVAEALASHLSANRFEKWLLDEAIHRLVGGASAILADLTGNAYALSVDARSGAFTVIDHANASQPRPARTLSGGETFLASLALALALADQVAELAAGGVARLESLFLDEGFGTLDPDTMDVVASALDELGARGRTVGVVTHMRELAERLPVRFEVTKVGGTATIERVDV